jgi:cytochrome c2
VRGAKLFSKFQPVAGMACANCHRVDSEEKLVGPGLLNVAWRASNNVEERLTRRGIDPAAPDRVERYLHAAIVDPTGYVLPGYPDIMPKNWGKVFSSSQLDDLIAYLRSLNG